jgi:hypothetical protein
MTTVKVIVSSVEGKHILNYHGEDSQTQECKVISSFVLHGQRFKVKVVVSLDMRPL